jgi:hypothetical protein
LCLQDAGLDNAGTAPCDGYKDTVKEIEESSLEPSSLQKLHDAPRNHPSIGKKKQPTVEMSRQSDAQEGGQQAGRSESEREAAGMC